MGGIILTYIRVLKKREVEYFRTNLHEVAAISCMRKFVKKSETLTPVGFANFCRQLGYKLEKCERYEVSYTVDLDRRVVESAAKSYFNETNIIQNPIGDLEVLKMKMKYNYIKAIVTISEKSLVGKTEEEFIKMIGCAFVESPQYLDGLEYRILNTSNHLIMVGVTADYASKPLNVL